MNFIGIDLAWKISGIPRDRTGLATIDGAGHLIDVDLAATDDEIIAFVRVHAGDSCAVGIDAPLIVANESGQRPVERLLLGLRTPAYPANRSLFARVYGGVRGEALVERLAAEGFALTTKRPTDGHRTVFEVFPSPAYKSILGLDSTVKVKRRRGVRTADIQRGLGIVRDSLARGALDPPLIIDDSILDRSIAGQDVELLHGGLLERFGDILDAIIAAYILYRYYRNPNSINVVGDIATGYVLLPT
ncbi:MAG TPA: DUF429 domain-containing protein [Anaerolineae bacterium]|nr:DUF429 domain-containing protein [Anaerolineae bacterium]